MAAPSDRKESIVSMHLPEADIAIIDRAALLHGCTRANFVREAAVRAAQIMLYGQPLVHMSQKTFIEFLEALASPGEAVPPLIEVLRRPAPWEAKQGERG